jgi:hypothetical protein
MICAIVFTDKFSDVGLLHPGLAEQDRRLFWNMR